MSDTSGPGKRQSLAAAFRCAGTGIVHTLTTQRNPKIHGVFALIAIVLGIVLQIDRASWIAVIICIMVVFASEIMNTAIETVVDLVTPAYHDLARIAKDCAAGAVLVCAIGSVVVACFVFLPPLVALLTGGVA